MPTIGSRKRVKAPDFYSVVGGRPSISPQAGVNVAGVSTPAAPSGQNASVQLGASLQKLGANFSRFFKDELDTKAKKGLEQGSSIADTIFSTRQNWADALKEAEKKGLIHNGENPYVRKGIMIRMGQLYGNSPEFKASLREGMEDFITAQLATDGQFPDFQAARNARLSEAVTAGMEQLPDSNFIRNLGFAPVAAAIVAKEGEHWDNFYKDAVASKNEELTAQRLQQFWKNNKWADGVFWFSTGVSEIEREGEVTIYKEPIPPYNTLRSQVKTKKFLYDSVVNHVFGDVVKPSTSLGYAQSLRKAIEVVNNFRIIKEPNSKTRLDAGEMGKPYGDLTQNLHSLLEAAEKGEAAKIAAAKTKTHNWIKNLATAHFLRNAQGLYVNRDMTNPESGVVGAVGENGLKEFMEDPAKHFRIFMERLRLGEKHDLGGILDSKGAVIHLLPRGQEGAHPLYAPDGDVFEYLTDQRLDFPAMNDAITEIERQLRNQRTNRDTLTAENKAAFLGEKAAFANKVWKGFLKATEDHAKLKTDKKHRELDPRTGEYKVPIRKIGWDDSWVLRYTQDLTDLKARGDQLFDYEVDLFEIVNEVRGLLNTNFKDSRVTRPEANVAEVYRRIFATSGPRKGMLKWLIDGGEARQRQVFGSGTFNRGELGKIPGWNLSEEFQNRLVSMLNTKAEAASDLLTFDEGTTANKHTRNLISSLQTLQPDLGPFLMSEFAPQFKGIPLTALFQRTKAHNTMSLLALRFMETDYIPLVEQLLRIHNYDMVKVKTDLQRIDGPLWSKSKNPIDIKDPQGNVLHTFQESLLYKFHQMGYDSDFDKINKDPNDYPGGYKERGIRMHREAAGLYPQNHPRGGDKDLLKNPGH